MEFTQRKWETTLPVQRHPSSLIPGLTGTMKPGCARVVSGVFGVGAQQKGWFVSARHRHSWGATWAAQSGWSCSQAAPMHCSSPGQGNSEKALETPQGRCVCCESGWNTLRFGHGFAYPVLFTARLPMRLLNVIRILWQAPASPRCQE